MPNNRNMKNIKTTALAKLGSDANSDPISLRMLGNAFMDLKGLNTLNVLKALRLAAGIAGINSMIPIHTTRKSSQFHGSLRYEFLWTQNPMARILITASRVKVMVKIRPLASIAAFLGVKLSLSE